MSERTYILKVGSSTLTDASGHIDAAQIDSLSDQIEKTMSAGWHPVVVSSGAVACGLEALGQMDRPKKVEELQAAASVGQGLLVHRWTEALRKKGIIAGQVLLTQSDFAHREQYLNARNAIQKMIELGVVPIINENDATAVQEIRMGDNDILAAMVAGTIDASCLVLLSDVVGLCDPESGECVSRVDEITPSIEAMVGGGPGTHGSGGMATKLAAARVVTNSGVPMVIAHGRANGIVQQVLEGIDVGFVPGTYFSPVKKRVPGRRGWIAFGRIPKGDVLVDAGAAKAIVESGRSLLAAGITGVNESFSVGDTVNIIHEGALIARGLTNFSAEELSTIKGLRSAEIAERLGDDFADEVIHRDSLALIG